ncbi:MAG: T9SS type A sorting domain-containing protein [Bacteroidia bacterium]
MRLFIYLFCCFLLTICNSLRLVAQDKHHIPFKNGHWFYTIGQIDATTEISCVEVESLKDSIINGEFVNIFDVYRKRGNKARQLIAREILLEKSDTIWLKDPNSLNYWPLYSFSSNIGDTFYVSKNKFKPGAGFFSMSNDSLNSLMYMVVLKDSVWIERSWRRRIGILDFQSINGLNWCFGLSDTTYFIDGIGATTYFFGQSRYVTAATSKTKLRCFFQDSIYVRFPNHVEPCDYSILLGLNNEVGNNFKIGFTNEEIEVVEFVKPNLQFKIFSMTGHELKGGLVKSKISIEDLPVGVYVFYLIADNYCIYTQKFLKQ